ncbi:DDE-type integrase/transposase/recombinase [Archaeoglobus sp.]|uniref:DDE-type integrase/transposase/recombinase n=1 Tax=Archaeoglobus sp. TaxID=1872626 RepID=UPI0024ABB016|nr:DDE-type integrase/transposase/recombinase [Archaeoglobus sp.]MDI3498227.1 putative transposase [Archaeoglobus sp.]
MRLVKNSGKNKILLGYDQARHRIRKEIFDTLRRENLSLDMMSIPCHSCGSKNVRSIEIRERKRKGEVKVLKCQNCGRKFVDNLLRSHLDFSTIATILELTSQFRSPSLIVRELEKRGMRISKPSIYSVLTKAVEVLIEFEEIVTFFEPTYLVIDDSPQKISRGKVWITNLIDAKSRYWLACVVSQTRSLDASLEAIRRSEPLLQSAPSYIKSDGYQGHIKAIKELGLKSVYATKKENYGIVNEIESLHSWIRSHLPKEAVFKTESSLKTFLEILRFKHNFFREIGGKTPAQRVGIPFKPSMGWKFLLKIAIWAVAEYRASEKRMELGI